MSWERPKMSAKPRSSTSTITRWGGGAPIGAPRRAPPLQRPKTESNASRSPTSTGGAPAAIGEPKAASSRSRSATPTAPSSLTSDTEHAPGDGWTDSMRWPGVRGASRDSRASASAAGSRGQRGRRIGSNAPLAPRAVAFHCPQHSRHPPHGRRQKTNTRRLVHFLPRVQKVSPARPQPLSALSSAICRPAARGQAWWPVQQPDSAALKPRQSITCLFPAVAESMLRPGTPSALQCSLHTSVFSKSATASAAAC